MALWFKYFCMKNMEKCLKVLKITAKETCKVK